MRSAMAFVMVCIGLYKAVKTAYYSAEAALCAGRYQFAMWKFAGFYAGWPVLCGVQAGAHPRPWSPS
jgi:hypothetical protein